MITLSNGHKIPTMGLGTLKSAPDEVEQAVKYAIDIGYRHIDCAYVYGNEPEVGNAINDKISSGAVKREDLFITSKLWDICHDPKLFKSALQISLKNLQLDYLDLYLIHWPRAFKEVAGDLFPMNETFFSNVNYAETWEAMEELVDAGFVKSIGISNFDSNQVQRIIDVARIEPVMNQIECQPSLTQKELMEFCRTQNIYVTANSPLSCGDPSWAQPDGKQLMDEPRLAAIAKKYNKTAAQTLVRYQTQLGNVVILNSVTKSRIASNFDVFNFELTEEDVAAIDELIVSGRFVPDDMVNHHPHYPIREEF